MMENPITPVLQTSPEWEILKCPPDSKTTNFTTPPLKSCQRAHRKPVPTQLNLQTMFEYTPPPKAETRPTGPLAITTLARNRLAIEREHVQCMVCRNASFVSSTAELVCSHYVHPRCLQQFVTHHSRNEPRDIYPPCEICKYPAKPKDLLLNQHIRTTLLRSKQLVSPKLFESSSDTRPITPPSRPREQHPRRQVTSTNSSCYSVQTDEYNFDPFDCKVPINVSVKPVAKSLSLTSIDPSCQFIVTVSCPDYSYTHPAYHVDSRDFQYSARKVTVFADALNCTREELGSLRLERQFEYSSEGVVWVPVTAMLFEHALVLASPGSHTPLLFTNIEENLVEASFVSRRDTSICIRLILAEKADPVYITSTNRDHLFSFVAAINDNSLIFPIAKRGNGLSLQSPFIGDYLYFPPCHTVICIPETLPLRVIAEAVGRLRVFDRIGIIYYGNRIHKYSLNRQSWKGWSGLFAQPPPSPAFTNQSIENILSAASSLFTDDSASRSIIFVSDDGNNSHFSGLPQKIPIYTIGVGENHNPSLLTRISASTDGYYTFASREDVGEYITNLAFADQNLTHKDVTVTLKSRQGIISGISGYSSAPGENSSTIEESKHGNLQVKLGRLRAGQSQTFVLGVDVDEHIFKYTCEGTDLDILEVLVDAKMVSGSATVCERKSGRVTMELYDTPIKSFKGLHYQMPISMNDQLNTVQDRIALAAAASLDRAYKHIMAKEHTQALSIIRSMVQNLEYTSEHVSHKFQCNTRAEADIVVSTTMLVDVLLAETRFLMANLTQKATVATILQMNWILRSGRSFSRHSSLEAIYFDTNKMNVI